MKPSAAELKARLLRKVEAGEPIQFRRIHCELATSPAQLASADLLMLDHTAASPGFNPAAELLPLGNANKQLLQNAEIYRELIQRYPTIAGVGGTDPFRIPEKLLQQIKELGFVGVQNSPSIGLIDGKFRMHLEHSHISYDQEIAMLKLAKQSGLLTVATVFSETDADKMNQVGADILIVHPGPKGLISDCKELDTGDPLYKRITGLLVAESETILIRWDGVIAGH